MPFGDFIELPEDIRHEVFKRMSEEDMIKVLQLSHQHEDMLTHMLANDFMRNDWLRRDVQIDRGATPQEIRSTLETRERDEAANSKNTSEIERARRTQLRRLVTPVPGGSVDVNTRLDFILGTFHEELRENTLAAFEEGRFEDIPYLGDGSPLLSAVLNFKELAPRSPQVDSTANLMKDRILPRARVLVQMYHDNGGTLSGLKKKDPHAEAELRRLETDLNRILFFDDFDEVQRGPLMRNANDGPITTEFFNEHSGATYRDVIGFTLAWVNGEIQLRG